MSAAQPAQQPAAASSALELDGFLLAALRNPKDRLFLLKLDREMERFILDVKYVVSHRAAPPAPRAPVRLRRRLAASASSFRK